jgi:hypothetical protein
MRVFWWQRGLHVEPESQEEANMLVKLVDSVKFVDRPGSPREQLSKSVVRDHEAVPTGMPTVNLND